MDERNAAGAGLRQAGDSRRRKSAEASLTSGAVFTVAFGVAWSVTGWWFFIFPLLFAGVLPMVDGLRRIGSQKRRGELPPRGTANAASAEKQILLAAKENGGVVTPALVALKTELSIQEAEKALEEMAQRGYANMRVTDSGRIEYEFPEFAPPGERGGAESGQH